MPCFRPYRNNPFKAAIFVGLIPVWGMRRMRPASNEPNQAGEILERAFLPGTGGDTGPKGREQLLYFRLLGVQSQGLLQVRDRTRRVAAGGE